MIATQKKPAKAASKRTKANGSTEPPTTPKPLEDNGGSSQTPSAPPHKRRLPVRYSDEIAETICERLRTGETLNRRECGVQWFAHRPLRRRDARKQAQ